MNKCLGDLRCVKVSVCINERRSMNGRRSE